MADRGEYQSPQQQFEQVRTQVNNMPPEKVVEQVMTASLSDRIAEVKAIVDAEIRNHDRAPQHFEGNVRDADSAKAKVVDAKTAVQKVLIAVKSGKSLPLQGKDGLAISSTIQVNANRILLELSNKLNSGESISEQTSPHIYGFVHKVLSGQVSTVDQLAEEFVKLKGLQIASEGIYSRIQEAMVAAAQNISTLSKEQIQSKFGIEDPNKPDDGEIKTKKQLEELEGRVQTYEKAFGDLILQIRTNQKIKPTDAERLVQMLIHTSAPADPQFLGEILIPAGFKTDQIESLLFYSKDYKKLNELKGRQNYRYLEQYGLLTPELKSTFDIKSLVNTKNKLLVQDEKGMWKLSDVGRRLLKRRALGTLNQLMKHVDENQYQDLFKVRSHSRIGA